MLPYKPIFYKYRPATLNSIIFYEFMMLFDEFLGYSSTLLCELYDTMYLFLVIAWTVRNVVAVIKDWNFEFFLTFCAYFIVKTPP